MNDGMSQSEIGSYNYGRHYSNCCLIKIQFEIMISIFSRVIKYLSLISLMSLIILTMRFCQFNRATAILTKGKRWLGCYLTESHFREDVYKRTRVAWCSVSSEVLDTGAGHTRTGKCCFLFYLFMVSHLCLHKFSFYC